MPKTKKTSLRYDPSPYAGPSPKELKSTKAELRRILDPTHRSWKGAGVPLTEGLSVFGTNTELRAAVNEVGRIHGCHECLTCLATDTNQPWIGDHIPPTGLTQRVITHYGLPLARQLLPSCQDCSVTQAAFVKTLNATESLSTLSSWENKAILGGTTTQALIPSYDPKVSPTQGIEIQKNGSVDGCHICGTKIACTTYIADHCPPQQFLTSYMQILCAKLDIAIPVPVAKPHCPRCSSYQGGRMNELTRHSKALAKSLGIVVYS